MVFPNGESIFTSNITENNSTVSMKELLNIMEKLRPEHAILLSNYAPVEEMYEIENPNMEKWYCKKLLLINRNLYYNKIKNQFEKCDIKIRVYEE